MNWTGGSLRRHSKAHANRLANRQRELSETTRRDSGLTTLSSPSSTRAVYGDSEQDYPLENRQPFQPEPAALGQADTLDMDYKTSSGFQRIVELEDSASYPLENRRPFQPEPATLGQADTLDTDYKTSSGFQRIVELKDSPSPERHLRHRAAEDEADRQDNHGIMCHSIANPIYRQKEIDEEYLRLKKHLLAIPDWAGLAHQPSKYDSNRVTPLKRKRTSPQPDRGRDAPRTIQPARDAPSLRTEDISVRAGSYIHRATQTTPSISSRKGSTQSPGGDTTDWIPRRGATTNWIPQGKVDNESIMREGSSKTQYNANSKLQEQTFVARLEGITKLPPVIPDSLVPLDEAVNLNLSSWDMVRDHSRKETNAAPYSHGLNTSEGDAHSGRVSQRAPSILPSNNIRTQNLRHDLAPSGGQVSQKVSQRATSILPSNNVRGRRDRFAMRVPQVSRKAPSIRPSNNVRTPNYSERFALRGSQVSQSAPSILPSNNVRTQNLRHDLAPRGGQVSQSALSILPSNNVRIQIYSDKFVPSGGQVSQKVPSILPSNMSSGEILSRYFPPKDGQVSQSASSILPSNRVSGETLNRYFPPKDGQVSHSASSILPSNRVSGETLNRYLPPKDGQVSQSASSILPSNREAVRDGLGPDGGYFHFELPSWYYN